MNRVAAVSDSRLATGNRSESPGDSREVLVVDDNPQKTLAVQSVLQELDCRVVVASSAEAGLRELLQRNFALAILDIQMPGMDGFEMAQLIRSRPAHANLAIVFMSAIDQSDERLEKAYALGAIDFIPLPARRLVIKAKLAAILGLHYKAQAAENSAHESTERLKRMEERFRLLLAKAEDIAIFFIDASGVVVEWSHAAELKTGWSTEEIVGRSYSVLFVPGDVADQIPTEHMVTAASGRQDMSERWLLRKDGSRFWARFTLVALEEASRAGYGVVLRDVTMQYRTEQELQINRQQAAAAEARIGELQEVVRQLEAFSYSISHDIRAPLRSVRGFADAIVQEYGEALKGDGIVYLNRIRLATDRLEKMVADILAFSRVAPTELKLEAVDLNRLVRALIEETLSVHAPHARVGIQGSLPTVMGHASSLQQVFFNLVSNAIKFVAPGQRPEVTIRAETMSAEAVVWIEDNGIGIRAEDQTRIFEAFERIESVPPFPGTGVGLSIVRRTVERMGGTVGVTSNLGVGSRFWVKLRSLPPQP